MAHIFDEDGQPVQLYNCKRRIERSIDELVGLCKGLIADGKVTQNEAIFLHQWLHANNHVIDLWPANVIAYRLEKGLSSGFANKHEQMEIFNLLQKAVRPQPFEQIGFSPSTALPFDSPCPVIKYQSRVFCFTGKFAFGSRTMCEQEVLMLGGKISNRITYELDYLVIGLFGSRDWVHSSHGRKIEQAVKIKQKNKKLAIIPEDYWTESLQ